MVQVWQPLYACLSMCEGAQIKYAWCVSYRGPATWPRPLSCPHCSQMCRYTSLHPALSRGANGGCCHCGFQTFEWEEEIMKDLTEKRSKKKDHTNLQKVKKICQWHKIMSFLVNQPVAPIFFPVSWHIETSGTMCLICLTYCHKIQENSWNC